MERASGIFIFLAFLSNPAGAIGPDPIVEDERNRVSELMIQAHLEAADNSTVEGAKRAKDEDAIIPQVTASQSLIELQKDEMVLRRDIRAAEAEVPNITGANSMPKDIQLASRESLDQLASGPRFDGQPLYPVSANDEVEPGIDDAENSGGRNADMIARAMRTENSIASYPASVSGESADAVLIDTGKERVAHSIRGPIVERGSFQLELDRPETEAADSIDSAEKNRIIF